MREIVFLSSAGAYCKLRTSPIREDHLLDPDSPVGSSKLATNKCCMAYGRLYGFEAVCLRYFNVYGLHQRFDAYGNMIPMFARRMISGEPEKCQVMASIRVILSMCVMSLRRTCDP